MNGPTRRRADDGSTRPTVKPPRSRGRASMTAAITEVAGPREQAGSTVGQMLNLASCVADISLPRDLAEPPGLVVLNRLDDLALAAHHERSVLHDRFAQRTPRKQQRLRPFASLEMDAIPVAENSDLAVLYRAAGDAD